MSMTMGLKPPWKTKLRWKARLRWQAKLAESTARETAHLIAMVLNMHLDPTASRTRRMVFRNSVLLKKTVVLNKTVLLNKTVVQNNALIHTNPENQGPGAEPAIQVVLHWRRFNQQRCHVEILSSREGSVQDPWSLAIAHRLRQILD